MKTLYKLLLFFFLIFNLGIVYSQNVDVQINISPPYSNILSKYFDDLTKTIISVTNLSGNDYDVNLHIKVYRNQSLFGETVPGYKLNSPIKLTAYGVEILTGEKLRDLFKGISTTHINHNLSIQELNNLLIFNVLPEGAYSICVSAHDFLTDQLLSSSMTNQGCSFFPVISGNPAELILPVNQTKIENLPFPISWTPAISTVGSNLTYTLEIRDITNLLNLSVQEVQIMDNLRIFNQAFPNTTFYQYDPINNADPPLQKGNTYQIDLITKDVLGNISFKNKGRSTPVRFTYQGKKSTESMNLTIAYPANNDTLPFAYTPFVVKYAPYQYYSKFDFTLQVTDAGSGKTYVRTDDNKWPNGPLAFLQKYFNGATQAHAQHLPLNIQSDQEKSMGILQRGHTYNWSVPYAALTYNNLPAPLIPINGSYTCGMKSPKLQTPKNESVTDTGKLSLKWKSSGEPTKFLPPYRGISNISKGKVSTQKVGKILENWVLQVAVNTDFSQNNLVYSKSGFISYDPESVQGNYDSSALKKNVYKDLNLTIDSLSQGIYYWRVVYLSSPVKSGLPSGISKTKATKQEFSNYDIIFLTKNQFYVSSPTWKFEVKKGSPPLATTPKKTPQDTTAATCGSGCDIYDISSDPTNDPKVPVNIKTQKFTTITVGGFKVTDLKNLKESKKVYSGEGSMIIPFMNDVKIHVKFTSVQVNVSAQAFAGKFEGMIKNQFKVQSTGDFIKGDNLKAIWGQIQSYKIFTGSTTKAIDLPVGLDYDILGVKVLFAISNMVATPQKATMNLVSYLDIPALNSLTNTQGMLVNLAASDICFNPKGFGKEFLMHLYGDQTPINYGNYTLSFKGSTKKTYADIKKEATYLELGCNGWESMAFRGQLEFSRDHLVPDLADGKPGSGKVKATFGVQFDKNNVDKTSSFKHWIASLSIDPFQVAGLEGWGFNVSQAFLDMSDLANPAAMVFPKNYFSAATSNTKMQNTWQGFYLQKAALRLPNDLMNTNTRVSIDALKDMIIDKNGFTASIGITDVAQTGNIGGWYLSLDEISIQILKNSLQNGGIKGKLGMPIFHENDKLLYSALLQKSTKTQKLALVFNVLPPKDGVIRSPALLATAKLEKNSFFKVQVTSGDSKIESELHGTVSLGDKVPSGADANKSKIPFTMPGIKFDLVYDSNNGIDSKKTHFSYASGAKSLSGFPLTIEDIDISGGLTDLTLMIEPKLSLVGSNQGFACSAKLNIIGNKVNLSNIPNNVTHAFKFGKMTLSGINIDVNFKSITLKGGLAWYDNTNQAGVGKKGINGVLCVGLPMNIQAKLQAEFGSVQKVSSSYSYFYIDGMVKFTPGINIAPGMSLTGLGGGFAYNMKPSVDIAKNLQTYVSNVKKTSAKSGASKSAGVFCPDVTPDKSGISYVPEKGHYGLQFAVSVADPGSSGAYSIDATLAANFSDNGLKSISLSGNAKLWTGPNESTFNQTQGIWGDVSFKYETADGGKLQGQLNIYVNLFNVLTGYQANNRMVNADFLVEFKDGGNWHFFLGEMEETKRGGLKLQNIPFVKGQINAYFMVGNHGIPNTLPPLPKKVQDILGNAVTASGRGGLNPSDLYKQAQNSIGNLAYGDAKGFATGFFLEAQRSLNAFVFYDFGFLVGFDLNITQDKTRTCDINNVQVTPGKDGWYGMGQAYAALWGEIGLDFGLFDFTILSLKAAVALSGGTPEPSWFQGRVGLKYNVCGFSGTARFSLEVGDKCIPTSFDPFGGITLIDDLLPNGAGQKVNTNVSAKFKLPLQKPLYLPRADENGNIYSETVIPVIYNFNISSKSEKIEIAKEGKLLEKLEWNSNNTICIYDHSALLGEKTDYKIKIVIAAKNKSGVYFSKNNKINTQEKEAAFTTGSYPEKIGEFVDFTIPLHKKRFAMINPYKGYVVFTDNLKHPYFSEAIYANAPGLVKSQGKPVVDFYLRFNPIDPAVTAVDVPVPDLFNKSSVHGISFTMPTLQANTIYKCQFIRKVLLASDLMKGLDKPVKTDTARDAISEVIVKYSYALPPLPGSKTAKDEFSMCEFYFKTGKYSSASSKINDYAIDKVDNNMAGTKNDPDAIYKTPKFEIYLSGLEAFDKYDVYGAVGKKKNSKLYPKIPIYDKMATIDIKQRIDLIQEIIKGYESIRNKFKSISYQIWKPYDKDLWALKAKLKTTKLKQGRLMFNDFGLVYGLAPPLNDVEINNEWSWKHYQNKYGNMTLAGVGKPKSALPDQVTVPKNLIAPNQQKAQKEGGQILGVLALGGNIPTKLSPPKSYAPKLRVNYKTYNLLNSDVNELLLFNNKYQTVLKLFSGFPYSILDINDYNALQSKVNQLYNAHTQAPKLDRMDYEFYMGWRPSIALEPYFEVSKFSPPFKMIELIK